MNIAVVSYASCTRCIKESRMLAKAGHKLWFFSYATPQISENIKLTDIFVHITRYRTKETLQILLANLDFIDIVHVHNEPSWMVNIANGQ